ncbi:MAG: sulfotransferase [Planctomycetales bacterium]
MLFHSEKVDQRLAAESPVVVMARGHSGTRVLAWALQKLGIRMGASEQVPTGDVQDQRFSRTIKRVCRATLHQSPTADVRGGLLRVFQRSVIGYLEWLGEDRSLWGWKFPESYLIPNYIAATFPNARYIHLVRDGRDIAFKHHLTDDPNRRLGRKLLKHLAALDLPHHVQAAMSWDFQMQRYDQFRTSALPAVHTISFESLCQDPIATMQGVCQFLRCPMNAPCRDYLSSVINPGKVAQYRQHDLIEVTEAEAVMTASMSRYGYLTRAA